MISIDTNIVVRFLIRDDETQYQKVVALFRAETVWIPLTVILETEWVLRSRFRFPRSAILKALGDLATIPGIVVEEAERFERALALSVSGVDFADALHLAATPAGASFVTFDQDLQVRARAAGLACASP
jgi:predicted nucleic-acid-binding protein